MNVGVFPEESVKAKVEFISKWRKKYAKKPCFLGRSFWNNLVCCRHFSSFIWG